jgi:subtilisin family serine protease
MAQWSRVLIDGTSASAPIVSGAIAAVMSQYPVSPLPRRGRSSTIE